MERQCGGRVSAGAHLDELVSLWGDALSCATVANARRVATPYMWPDGLLGELMIIIRVFGEMIRSRQSVGAEMHSETRGKYEQTQVGIEILLAITHFGNNAKVRRVGKVLAKAGGEENHLIAGGA